MAICPFEVAGAATKNCAIEIVRADHAHITGMKLSSFGQSFTRKTGIVDLMEDFGHSYQSPHPVYMLGGGNPAQIPQMQQRFRQEMMNLLDDGNSFERMIGNYDVPQGESEFIDNLARLLKRKYGWPLSSKNIALTNGSQSSFFALFNAFGGEYQDGSFKQILLPLAPEYIGYTDIATNRSLFRSTRPSIEFRDSDYFKYRVDFDALPELSGISAICVSRPTNPTGNVITDNELNTLSKIAKQQDIPLIIDGAYGIPFPGIIFNDANVIWDEHIILCFSLSKLGLPGVRTGIVIGNEEAIEMISHLNAIYHLAIGSTGPVLVNSLMKSGEILELSQDVIKPYYYRRMREAVGWVKHYMRDLPVLVHQPEGAIFLWLWFQNLPISTLELYRRLKSKGIFVIAGEHFFPGLEADDWQHKHECIRLSYAGNPEVVESGIELIARELQSVYSEN